MSMTDPKDPKLEASEGAPAPYRPRRLSLSGSDLKLIAITAMFIDHFAAVLIYKALTTGGVFETEEAWNAMCYVYDILRLLIGRIAFPIFCFLLLQGFLHTRNRLRYAARLLLFAVVSEIPFDLAFNQSAAADEILVSAGGLVVLETGYQNVFFTLFLGLIVLILTDAALQVKLPVLRDAQGSPQEAGKVWVWLNRILCAVLAFVILAVGIEAAEYLATDYGGYGVLVIAVLFYFNRAQNLQIAAGSFVLIFGDYLFYSSWTELLAPVGLLLTKYYNGRRGMPLKYVFYVFYPVHLLLLVALRQLLF